MAVTPVDVAGAYTKGTQVNALRQQMEAQKAEIAQKNAMRQLLSGGVPSDAPGRQQFIGQVGAISGDPSKALDWGKFFQSQDAAKLEQQKTQAPYYIGALRGVKDQAGYDQARAMLQQRGLDVSDMPPQYDPSQVNMVLQASGFLAGLKPESYSAGSTVYDPATGQQILSVPSAPGSTLGKLIADRDRLPQGDPRRAQYDAAIRQESQGSAGESGPFGGTSMDAQAINILLQGNPNSPEYLAAYNHYAQPKQTYNPATGQYIMITPDMSAYRPPAGRGRAETQPAGGESFFGLPQGAAPQQTAQQGPGVTVTQVGDPLLNEGEKTAAGFANRMDAANKVITDLEEVGASSLGGVYQYLPNLLKPADRQRFEQAQRDFINAVLRQQSGAVIAESEFESAAQQYFPQPGDNDSVIAQKRAARDREVQNMRLSAGRAPAEAAPAQQQQTPGTIPPPPDGFVLVN